MYKMIILLPFIIMFRMQMKLRTPANMMKTKLVTMQGIIE